MNRSEIVNQIHVEVVDQNLEIYKRLFQTTEASSARDPYWKSSLGLFESLSAEQKEVFFKVIRQTIVDSTSNLLGILDGVIRLRGQSENFKLTWESSTEMLNEDLQDLFLEKEEQL
jgi:hypothetical protein